MFRWFFCISFLSCGILSAPYHDSIFSISNSRIPRIFDKQQRRSNCNCECGRNNRQQRVVGGEDAKPHEFPWLVGLGTEEKFHCGASLISRRHVLTAAHCVNGFEEKTLKVVFGDHDRSNKISNIIQERKIRKVRIHEGFVPSNYNNDIAILELEKPINFNQYIQPICIPKKVNKDYTNSIAIVAGWGRTEEKGETSEILKKAAVPIWSREDCLNAGYQQKKITQNMFCAGYKEGKIDGCQGDSGGPLQITNDDGNIEVVGLISWGRGCARRNLPGIYTKVVNYLDWIKQAIGDDCLCY